MARAGREGTCWSVLCPRPSGSVCLHHASVHRPLEKLPRRLEAQPFVHRHCRAAGVDRHANGPEGCRMLRRSLHQRRADPLAALLRHDEDALDVCGQPTGRSRSRYTRDERDPGHTDDLRLKKPSHERQVRLPVCSPPLRELHRERVNGPLIWLLFASVQPQEPGQVRDVVRIRRADDHKVSLPSAVEPKRPTAVRQDFPGVLLRSAPSEVFSTEIISWRSSRASTVRDAP